MTAAEQLEQAAERYADELRVSTAIPGALVPMLHDIARTSYICGAKDALASQWISVKEQLPEDLEQVLVRVPPEPIFPDLTMPGYSTIAYRDNGRWRSWMDNTCHPTHWLPIPKFNNEDEES